MLETLLPEHIKLRTTFTGCPRPKCVYQKYIFDFGKQHSWLKSFLPKKRIGFEHPVLVLACNLDGCPWLLLGRIGEGFQSTCNHPEKTSCYHFSADAVVRRIFAFRSETWSLPWAFWVIGHVLGMGLCQLWLGASLPRP